MKRTFALAIAVLLCASSAGVVFGQSGHDLFQQALVKERADGNLIEAIKLYQRVVSEFARDRALSARALVQIGQCYEKLGEAQLKQARASYERVVREYADQAEIVAQARVRLAVLGGPSPTTLTARRLENPPEDTPSGAISPDGRYFSFCDFDTGDLAIRDLQTGKDRRLTNEGTLGDENATVSQEAGVSTWSSDGKQIAYEWYRTSDAGRIELRVVGLDGGKPRILTRNDGGSFAWSPDRKHIVASVSLRNKATQIVLISTIDGSTRALTDLKRVIYPTTVRFSPDGRYVAYDRLPDDTSPERDIVLMSIDTGQETPLIQHPADDYLLGLVMASGSSSPVTAQAPSACGLLACPAPKPRESRDS